MQSNKENPGDMEIQRRDETVVSIMPLDDGGSGNAVSDK